jgi:hypothetical protein
MKTSLLLATPTEQHPAFAALRVAKSAAKMPAN